ncbi:BamA/TamA family outer membrane protein [Prevotella sp. MA2016]|uniref:translocation and assembly module lipoprotein TamL n=1 Tax=Prevotella sp. MA2016 TaxID=1408310 RepID=UPI000A4C63F5|nr:BamA/TamA family outer membrane protein [Prevotella sp. MA2016]
MNGKYHIYIPLMAVAVAMCSCSVSRDIPEDSYLLNKTKVVADGKYRDINPGSLKGYVRQKPNSRWFSAVKLPLGVYAMAGKDSSWVNRMLRQMGEAPVIYDTVQAQLTCRDLQQALQNKGYLDAQVELYIDKKKHKLDAVYVLHPGEPYFVRNLDFVIEDSVVANLLRKRNTLLHQGMQFSVETLSAERNAITQYLQNNGYFRFHKEYITYGAKKDEAQHGVDLKLLLQQQHKPYTIGSIMHEGGQDDDGKVHLRQSVLVENTFLAPGDLYSAAKLQNTYNHFGRLGAVRYTNIAFEQQPDTTLLDTKIQVLTNKPSTISFQPEGTNTAGDFGAAASLTYQNRNLFKGSETFSLQLRGAYEAIKGLEGYSNQDFTEYSVETKLSFPRFIMPFLSRNFRRRTIATSELALLYDVQDRPEFHRRVLSTGWSYHWRPQNHHDSYRFDLLNLNYVFMPWISETFKTEYLDNTSNQNVILRYNYEDLFIMKMGFGYTYNNGVVALKTNVETAGNLLGLCSNIFGSSKNELGQYELFNIAYAQYVKGDFDYTQQLFKGANDQLVFHIGLGVAYPYGNAKVLPFEKRYFSGGANSVRGWTVRSLGPGRYKDKDGRINFITMTGDLKLDLNVEYRMRLFWKFNGAIFADAGNVWTLRDYPDQPGGQFKFNRFLSDLAVSYGAGLRLNFDYFILRFDLGMKAINPAFEIESEAHYPLVHPKLSRDLAFHFAVGMPF